MGLFGNLFSKKEGKETRGGFRENAHSFDDMDRVHATTMRRYNQELKKIQLEMQRLEMKKQLEELKEELEPEYDEEAEDGSLESGLMQVLTPMLLSKGQSPLNHPITPPSNVPTQKSQAQEISDEEIRNFLDTLDKNKIKLGKTMPKTMVYRIVTSQFPMTNEEFERAYKILKEEY